MFPYRPRPPTYGSKLKKKKTSEAEGSSSETPTASSRGRKRPNILAPLSGGGPVERAIKKDLIALRQSFCSSMSNNLKSNGNAVVDSLNDPVLPSHDETGNSFGQFKEVFRRGKFGMIHARCIPPRCDKADYEQMLYSACLGLLKETMVDGGNLAVDGRGMFNASERLCDAACSVFSLYVLYETNPQPSFPSRDRGALRTLAMGLASEDTTKLYRRTYRENIRISREQYAILQMIRDYCLEEVAICESNLARNRERHICSRISTVTCDTAAGSLCIDLEPAGRDRDRALCFDWSCSCGIARDCIQVIDKMCANEVFDYCEYAGPCSTEGLAGSSEYYQKVLNCQAVISSGTDVLFPSNCAGGTMGNLKERGGTILSDIDLPNLDLSYRKYRESLESIEVRLSAGSNSGRRGGVDVKISRQVTRIQGALVPVLGQGGSLKYGNFAGQLRLCCAESSTVRCTQPNAPKMATASRGNQTNRTNHISLCNRIRQEKKTDKNVPRTRYVAPVTHPAAVDRDTGERDDRLLVGGGHYLRIVHSPKISKPLKKGINRALEGLPLKTGSAAGNEDIKKKEKVVREYKSSAYVFPLVFGDEYLPDNREEEGLVCSGDNYDGQSLENESDESSELVSRASTLIGQNALHNLLSKATSSSRTRPPKKHGNVAEANKMDMIFGDNHSAISRDGVGQAALGVLLAEAKLGTDASSRKRPAAGKGKFARKNIVQCDNESFKSRDGVGQAALDSLLKEAKTKQNHIRNKRKASGQLKTVQPLAKQCCVESPGDVDSLATGDGAGHAALGLLLARLQDDEQGCKSGESPGRDQKKPADSSRDFPDDTATIIDNERETGGASVETSSVATGAGRNALKNLLLRVTDDTSK